MQSTDRPSRLSTTSAVFGGGISDLFVPLVLLALALLFLIEPVLEIVRQIELSTNEGWNAYHADRAMRGANLYDTTGRLIAINYPPLSFYVVGTLGSLIGDNVVAGRIIAGLSLAATATNVALIARRLSGSPVAAAISGLFFLAYFAAYFTSYVGINDPQMLAHALITAAILALFDSRQRPGRLALSAVLVCLAGFVKHNLVGVPIAMALYLLVYDRRRLALWLAWVLGTLAVLFAATVAAFGTAFLEALVAPRHYTLKALGDNSTREYFRLQVPILFWLLLAVLFRRDRGIVFIALYVAAAGLTAVAFSGGDGISYNVFFDLLIGLALAMGVGLVRIRPLLLKYGITGRGARTAMTVLALALIANLFVAVPVNAYKLMRRLETLPVVAADTAVDIRFLRDQKGPAFCKTLTLCYWAGKAFEVDPFAARQSFLTGRVDHDRFMDLVRNGYFTVLQLPETGDENGMLFVGAIAAAAADRYHVAKTSANGRYLVRKQGSD